MERGVGLRVLERVWGTGSGCKGMGRRSECLGSGCGTSCKDPGRGESQSSFERIGNGIAGSDCESPGVAARGEQLLRILEQLKD